MSKKKKTAIIISVLAVVLLVGAALWFVNSKLSLVNFDKGGQWTVVSYTDGSPSDMSDSDKPDASETVALISSSDDIFNILLIGTDERNKEFSNGARSDSMTICSINKRTNKIKLVSLERGTKVTMPDGRTNLLTHAFHFGGPDYLFYAIENHFGLKMDKYIRVNFYTFEKAVDAVGGVDIELTSREAEYLNMFFKKARNLYKNRVKRGNNHLNGYQALQYCRLRKSDSNWERIVRQRNCIKAIQTSCKNLSLSELNTAIDTILPLVMTNLTKGEIVSLAARVPSLLSEPIDGMSLPKKVDGKYPGYTEQSGFLHDFLYGE